MRGGGRARTLTSKRFTDGKGWLQGTQAFLQIGSHDRPGSTDGGSGSGSGSGSGGGSAVSSIAPSSGATKSYASDREDPAQLVITVRGQDPIAVLIYRGCRTCYAMYTHIFFEAYPLRIPSRTEHAGFHS